MSTDKRDSGGARIGEPFAASIGGPIPELIGGPDALGRLTAENPGLLSRIAEARRRAGEPDDEGSTEDERRADSATMARIALQHETALAEARRQNAWRYPAPAVRSSGLRVTTEGVEFHS